MDFRFTSQENDLRSELRAFLREALPPDWNGPGSEIGDDDWDVARDFNAKLAARGWIAPAWPREYGGLGAGQIEQMIFAEELGHFRAPPGQRIFGVGILGPTLLVHGSEDQRREHLPPITEARVSWCQGYSEPGAGSDLASVKTSAVRDGDDYVINGQKIWTTGAHHSDWIFLLARTDPDLPKHKGISFFLVDMKSAGLSVRPLINLQNRHEFNEVYFENVRVPRRNMVGPENGGWYVGMTLLDFERSSIASIASARRTLEELAEYARGHALVAPGSAARTGLAEFALECEVARMLSYRIGSMQAAGKLPNYESSMLKVFVTEMRQRLYNFGVGLLGLFGQIEQGTPAAPLGGRVELGYLESVAPTIYSGSNEIQRTIIATRGLGLPRD